MRIGLLNHAVQSFSEIRSNIEDGNDHADQRRLFLPGMIRRVILTNIIHIPILSANSGAVGPLARSYKATDAEFRATVTAIKATFYNG